MPSTSPRISHASPARTLPRSRETGQTETSRATRRISQDGISEDSGSDRALLEFPNSAPKRRPKLIPRSRRARLDVFPRASRRVLELGQLLFQNLAPRFQLPDQLLGVGFGLARLGFERLDLRLQSGELCLNGTAQLLHDFLRVRP